MNKLTNLVALICGSIAVAACGGAGGSDDEGNGGMGGSGGGDVNGQGGSGDSDGSQTVVVGDCTLTTSELSVNGTVPTIATTKDGFAIAYRSAQEIRLAILDAKAKVLDNVVVAEAANPGLITAHMIGDKVEVVWADGSTIKARSMSLSGEPLDSPMVVSKTDSDEPRPHGVALDDGSLGLVWMNQPAIEGVVLEDMAEVDTTTATGWFPTLMTGDGGLGMAWSDGGQEGPVAFGFFDSPDDFGTVPGSAALIKAGVSVGGTYYVVWEDIGNGDEPVVDMAAFDASLNMIGHVSVSPGDASANWPAIAKTDTGLVVTYYQFREGPSTVYGQNYTLDMEPDGEEFVLADGAKYPTVASAHGTELFAYQLLEAQSLMLTASVCE